MKHHSSFFMTSLFTAMIFAGCTANHESPDVSSSIRKSLDQAGLKDVSVNQDRDKGVVTLGGRVAASADKMQAESLAKSEAAAQVVADEIQVLPPGDESTAKTVDSDLDQGIEKNFDALLVQDKLNKAVKSHVKNGVVTLTGNVNSETRRSQAGKLAASVPNVQQVVNELQIKDQKATSN